MGGCAGETLRVKGLDAKGGFLGKANLCQVPARVSSKAACTGEGQRENGVRLCVAGQSEAGGISLTRHVSIHNQGTRAAGQAPRPHIPEEAAEAKGTGAPSSHRTTHWPWDSGQATWPL